ncbi:MAG: polysaccharide biosynthesis protein [Bacteroidota bacterium]|jgi:FlaA1/EpsC-like NDP-sugar epimerase|nr:polysaccharide biosynthesis protein [Ignavibacteria bacterium]MCU7499407.1 polysaccharide biosynthesis protein [Ignavibacteria bacterium]MCU7511567.1 polysaccharide biosynthesis protein [Ignavibacteria bacterium]MCU7521072.1 polysaccharide biosynthesis protein [Ignavibacteria bacterium]MCU7524307.1 polysaccharide biosynthesis protein [Ignavibacteria bacterium]
MALEILSNQIKKLCIRHFLLMDIIIFFFNPYLALFIRLDGTVNWDLYSSPLLVYSLLFTLIKLAVLGVSRFYGRLWRMASVDELAYAIFISAVAVAVEFSFFYALEKSQVHPFVIFPVSLPLLDGIFSMITIVSIRFSIRFIDLANQKVLLKKHPMQSVLIAGAGESGFSIALEMQRNAHLGLNPVAFVDDDSSKHNLKLRGIPIKGSTDDIASVIKELNVSKVIIAMPMASGIKIRQIMSNCEAAGVETLTVPGIFEILNGNVNISKIRKIQIEDLLRREPVITDNAKVKLLLKGKKVLITGAGGSIGSELCRQVLRCNPAGMILIGHGENSIFEIEQELLAIKKEFTGSEKLDTVISARIADLRSRERLRGIFDEFYPDVIFHAAAHKHVPLMESNPQEAVTNNILGTKNIVSLAVEYGVRHFISISSDKAVNPTNIMGASKRATEMIVLEAARKTGWSYSAVRFGNVLGSRGSVVRTFQKQLQNGGPITITHPEIIRYFMTIPEAVQLVLQASVLNKGGEVFVLDMGQPVKIIDLAKDIIRLAGLSEGTDIEIKVTGLRPGEKLYEELFIEGEHYEKTIHDKILIARNASSCISNLLSESLNYFEAADGQLSRGEIIDILCELIPEFQPQDRKSHAVTKAFRAGNSGMNLSLANLQTA